MHEVYGIDLESGEFQARSWRWMSNRVRGLFRRPPTYAPDGTSIPSTRIGLQLEPPEPKSK